jgi:hypothetical protein
LGLFKLSDRKFFSFIFGLPTLAAYQHFKRLAGKFLSAKSGLSNIIAYCAPPKHSIFGVLTAFIIYYIQLSVKSFGY